MLRNVGSNWVLIVVTIGASYITTPYVIRLLGNEGYGTWTLITAMTGYVSLLALGVPMACVRYLAQDLATGEHHVANRTIATCAGLYVILGALAVVAGVVMSVAFSAYDLPEGLRTQAYLAFSMMVFYVAASFIGFLPEGILFAHHDFVRRNLVRVGGVLLRLLLTLWLLRVNQSIAVLAGIQVGGLLFDMTLTWLIIRRRHPFVRIRVSDFDWVLLRRIFAFSVYVLILGAGARLIFETDALVIGAILGVAAIPAYAVPNSLMVYMMEFVIGIAAVVGPMATTLSSVGNDDELRRVFLKWSKMALSVTLAGGVFLIVLGPRFIALWIGPEYEQTSGPVLQILMASALVFLPARGVALPVLMGIGKPQLPTLAFLAAGALNLMISVLLAPSYGLIGVAIGTAVPNVLLAFVMVVLACRELRITVPAYVGYVVPRASIGALPILALLVWCRSQWQVSGLGGLTTAAATMGLLFAVVWVMFVYRGDPYVDVRAPILRLRAWSRA